jgi:glycosyltransferase involved in cell wall biosynthesis
LNQPPHNRPRPLISVITPAHNASHFFDDWLRSILAQEYPNLEIFLVDDGSNDGDAATGLRARAASVPGLVHYVRLEGVGPAAARNHALGYARGEYIAFLDLDDRWTPGHMHRLTAALEIDADAGIAQGQIRKFLIADDGRAYFCSEPYRFVNLGAALYRRSVYDSCGLFDPDLRFGEDFDYVLRCWEKGIRRIDIPEVSLLYQRHDHNMTNGKSVVDLGAVRCYKRRLDRMRAGQVDPAVVEQRRVSFTDYLGRTAGPFDEGYREAMEL